MFETKPKFEFTKLSHKFAHRKKGAERRFQMLYDERSIMVKQAWISDLERLHEEFREMSKGNPALAMLSFERRKQEVETAARMELQTVFKLWRTAIDKIVSDLQGQVMPDGNVVFPDNSIAKYPRGLWIAPEKLLTASSS